MSICIYCSVRQGISFLLILQSYLPTIRRGYVYVNRVANKSKKCKVQHFTMELVDLILTPFYFLLILFIAYGYQSNNKRDFHVKKYFLSAYFLRIIGGIAFACVYAFYYGGGDTLNYHHDSVIISSALRTDPVNGVELVFTNPNIRDVSTFNYIRTMIFRNDPASHFVSAIAAVFNLFTFDSFLSTTILFSLIGFWGNWRLFQSLCQLFPNLHKQLAIGCLYLPSILFWASGIMKDTLCAAAICLLFKAIVDIFIFNKKVLVNSVKVVLYIWVIFILKIYILFCFVPTIMIYIFSIINSKIRNPLIRKIIKPAFYSLAVLISFLFVRLISQDNLKYSFEKIEQTAQITAEYIGKVSLMSGGSFYSLGELDFSPTNLPILAVKAFNVTFYRPYIWEVSSPLMIFSVLESLYFVYLTYILLKYILKTRSRQQKIFTPFTSFCFLFAISFAFIVGVTSNNFGTLARYKALMLPFFVCGVYATITQTNHKKTIVYAPPFKDQNRFDK